MAGDFLIVNGVRLDVAVLSATRDLETSSDLQMSGSGEVLDQRRQGRRRWRMTTTCKSRREAQAIQALIEGVSHALAFDGELAASTSLMPSNVPPSTVKLRADGGFGGGALQIATDRIEYVDAISFEEWTILGRHLDTATMALSHVARRSDGVCFVNGARVAPIVSFPLAYAAGDGPGFLGNTIAGVASTILYSDCVIFKAWMPDEWIAQIAAHDGAFGPSPLLAVEGSMIDSDLGIFANGTITGGVFVQHATLTPKRSASPEDQRWQNNELEISFTLVEDDRVPALDALPFAETYAPMTSRAKVDSGTAHVVTSSAMSAAILGTPALVPGPSGDKLDLWARFDAGLRVVFNAHVSLAPSSSVSRFSASFWLFIKPTPALYDVIGAMGSSGSREWKVEVDTSNRVGFIVFDETATAFLRITTTAAVPVGEWIHVVVVHNSEGVLASANQQDKTAIFINGAQPATTASTSGVFQRIVDASRPLGIPDGQAITTAPAGIAHLATFGLRALTRADIRILYRLGRRSKWLRRV